MVTQVQWIKIWSTKEKFSDSNMKMTKSDTEVDMKVVTKFSGDRLENFAKNKIDSNDNGLALLLNANIVN